MALRAVLMSAHRVHSALRLAAAGLLFGLVLTPCAGGGIAAPRGSQSTDRDLLLTILARRALLLDAELGPLNLGVRVRNRVATLWGPVPSAGLGFKAEQRLRGLVELLEVHNELMVAPASAALPAPAMPAGFLPPAPPPGLPALPREMRVPPPLPPPPAIGAPSPVIDEIDLPPRRLPQGK